MNYIGAYVLATHVSEPCTKVEMKNVETSQARLKVTWL